MGLFDFIGGLAQAGAQIGSTAMTNQANKAAADLAYQREVEMWNLNNQYNSPASQMARLQSAGLNPNMVYGSGTVAGNTSGDYPKYQPPRYDFTTGVPNVMALMNASADLKLKGAQERNINASTSATVQRTVNDTVREFLLRLESAGKLTANQKALIDKKLADLQLDTARGLQKFQLQSAEAGAEKLGYEAKTAKTASEREALDKEFAQWRNDLAKQGVNVNDPAALRMFFRSMKSMGLDPQDMLKNGAEWLRSVFGN